MPKLDVLPATLGALGLGILGVFYFATLPAQAQDNPDTPNLVIEVDGSTQGQIVIDLMPGVAPQHVERVTTLASDGKYDGVVFHRVIDGFMAQTGDVEFGRLGENLRRAGTGGSDQPDVPAEFGDVSFDRGTVGMARSGHPDSANSQFFIMFEPAPHLNGQYTVFGQVVEGQEVVDAIKRGAPGSGSVDDPDYMKSVTVTE
ncbi:peptidylprolyl isomerase [Halocynthiibacter styelae]|uniref:Peptidyl-prolyl cis-trans isomerase n=1 Tax=Halocynthiibacter styelae TaxID=2761955 RepID=A0A8J7INL3_9RHOB|nr:peptidylprolyl isomerase [Paenihalocynthiibacter styelae]MBI1494116.1 peptidylprolyl isomerase [Paenihalocynthiibacter styelae]